MKDTLLTALAVAVFAGCCASDDEALLQAIQAKGTEPVERILARKNAWRVGCRRTRRVPSN